MSNSQSKLRKIKGRLKTEFAFLTRTPEVALYVERKMRENYGLSPYLYNDDRCQNILNIAMADLERAVKEKYEAFAKEINSIIDVLNDLNFETYHGEYSHSDFEHLVVGVGAGLGLAMVFGSPVGFMMAGGLLLGGLYNSDQKKKTLVDKIVDAGIKYNNFAINKIDRIIDDLLLSESDPKPFGEEKKEEGEILSPEQFKIKDFLDSRNIKYLIHFTDRINFDSIKENGILSFNEAKNKGIPYKVFDKEAPVDKVEEGLGISRKDFVSLSLSSVNVDLLLSYKRNYGIKEFAILYIDASILYKKISSKRIYFDRNASIPSARFGESLKDFKRMFDEEISYMGFSKKIRYSNRVGLPKEEATDDQAEIWFERGIDPSFIRMVQYK